jgi:hypothetical protein
MTEYVNNNADNNYCGVVEVETIYFLFICNSLKIVKMLPTFQKVFHDILCFKVSKFNFVEGFAVFATLFNFVEGFAVSG